MKIGILQSGHFPEQLQPELGDYSAMFTRLLGTNRFDYQTWDVVDMAFPDGPEEADGWLITGSRHGAYEDLPFIPPLEDFIRAARGAGRPMVGVCFGHQIIAQALGGRVEKFAGGWSVGRTIYDWRGEDVALNAWHQDQVVEVPEGAEVVARSRLCANAALVYGEAAFTVQAHPEFGDAAIKGLITYRSLPVEPDRVIAAHQTLGQPVQNAELGEKMATFFETRSLP